MSRLPPGSPTPTERRGRAVAVAIYTAVVSTITAIWSGQILKQVWAPEGEAATAACREGVHSLLTAVRRARAAAADETEGERASLERFRRELDPEWRRRPAIGQSCRHDPALSHALREIDLLRYAEEHAVRYDAVDVARRRKKMREIEQRVLSNATVRLGPPASGAGGLEPETP